MWNGLGKGSVCLPETLKKRTQLPPPFLKSPKCRYVYSFIILWARPCILYDWYLKILKKTMRSENYLMPLPPKTIAAIS